MSGFATLAPPYSMPSASHGDVELSDSTTNSQSRALNQFLAGVELKAFKIAQAALRHEDDALDAVQDAMFASLRVPIPSGRPKSGGRCSTGSRNRIRDMQRRRTVRGRVMSWLPFRANDEDDEEQDPIAQAPSFDPQPPVGSRYRNHGRARESARVAASPQQQVFMLRTLEGLDVAETATAMGCSEGSVKTHYFRALAVAPRATWRFLDMIRRPSGPQTPGEIRAHARALLEQDVQRVDGRIRSRLNRATRRH